MKHLVLTAIAITVLAVVFARSAATDTTGPVAYVGCSVSEMSVLGYHVDGGIRFWPSNSKYDSGFVSTWAGPLTNNRWWTAFDNMNLQHPGATQVWWQLCVQTGQTMQQLDADAQVVLTRIHGKLPGATVYVSALPEFSDHVCATTGLDGIANAETERDALVAAGEAEVGPVMPPLDLRHVYLGNTCHPNYQGQKLEGMALLGFFG